jgi:xylan 1,4-beta-xylosidase
LKHCADGKNFATGATGSPIDFVSFHAKGSPRIVEGHVVMNMSPQLRDVARGFDIIKTSPFARLPVLITECDPEGCAACGMTTNPENAYRNGTMYSSYTAASFARIFDLAEHYDMNLQAVTSWSFEFEGQRWLDGFRDLATNGVDKPVLNVFRMYGQMHGNRLTVVNDHDIPLDSILKNGVRSSISDVHALAVGEGSSVSIMLWNYHDSEDFSKPATVHLTIRNIPARKVMLHHYRIDGDHSNAYELWKAMGSPQKIDNDAYRRLERAGQLQLLASPQWLPAERGEISLEFLLPAHGVSMVSLHYH